MKNRKICWVNLALSGMLLVNTNAFVFANEIVGESNVTTEEILKSDIKEIPENTLTDSSEQSTSNKAYLYLPVVHDAANLTLFANGDTFSDGVFDYKIINEVTKEVEVSGLVNNETTSIIIPDVVNNTSNSTNYSVTKIGKNAFYNCGNLTNTGLENNSSVKTIGEKAYFGCSALVSTGLESNNTVNFINNGAFYLCTGLKTTGLNNNSNITSISDWTFYMCTSLESTGLSGNSTITSLGAYSYGNCKLLKSTELENNDTLLSVDERTFLNCVSLKTTGLENNHKVKKIGECAFENCSSLIDTGLENNETVNEIGKKAFFDCNSLQGDLVLNEHIKIIGEKAFSKTNYDQVYWLTTDSSSLSLAPDAFDFDETGSNSKIVYVPELFDADTLGTYQISDGSLVKMVTPQLVDIKIERSSESTAKITFKLDVTGNLIMKIGDRIVKSDVAQGNELFTFEVSDLSPFETEVSIYPQSTYPYTSSVKYYNTVYGTDENAVIPMFEYVLEKDFDIFKGSGNSVAKISSPKELFTRLFINGIEIEPSNYEINDGSTIITLKESYLKTLGDGTKYPVKFELATGQVIDANLIVKLESKSNKTISTVKKRALPKTGDTQNNIYFVIGIAIIGLVAGLLMHHKKVVK